MKKKVSLIMLSIVQIIVNVYLLLRIDVEAKGMLESLKDAFSELPKESIETFMEVLTLDFVKNLLTVGCVVTILITLAFLVLVCFNRVSKKKSLAICLLVGTLFFGESTLGMILSVVSLLIVIATKNDAEEKQKKKEKNEIKRLRDLKVTNKEFGLGILLLVVYFSQFVMPYVPMSDLGYIIGVISFHIIVFVLAIMSFAKRFKRDFGALKDNFGTYFKYILKMWGMMLLLSLIAGVVRTFLGGDTVSANQEALNNSDLLITVPLVIIWAPIVEETIFRGLLRRFIPNNDKLFIIVSAVVFGLMHTIGQEVDVYNTIVQSLQYAVMGGTMAYTYVKSNNICTNIGVHFCQNTMAAILMVLMSLA